MGGAQPLSVTMNEGVALIIEVDRTRIERRLHSGYCNRMAEDLDTALDWAFEAKRNGQPLSIGLLGNAADILTKLVNRGITPDILTDQTSAHDPLNGYVPAGCPLETSQTLRRIDPENYIKMAMHSIYVHVQAMLELQKRGSIVFEYGNNIRQQAYNRGLENAFGFEGFVPAYIRPLFCEGKGPFRWAALSGNPKDIYRLDKAIIEAFPENEGLKRWIEMAGEQVQFQGLPARICWLGYGERAYFGKIINDLVASGEVSAPIVIGRDHLDCGSVASPNRETEKMLDKSDAIADWVALNALINAVGGASWVSVHHGGGVGIGYALHAGMVIVADGTKEAEARLLRVLTTDPGTGVVRHVDAGNELARETARKHGIRIPMNE